MMLVRHARSGRLAVWLMQSVLAALVLFSLTALPARAGSVNVYDQSHVLDVAAVSQEAAKLPVDIDIYTLDTYTGDAGQLANYAVGHFTTQSSGMLLMMIDTVNRHIAIEGNAKASFGHQQYVDARTAFGGAIKSGSGEDDFSAAVIAALKSFEQAASSTAIGTVLGWIVVLLLIAAFFFLCIVFGGGRGSTGSRNYTYIDTEVTSSGPSTDGTAGSF